MPDPRDPAVTRDDIAPREPAHPRAASVGPEPRDVLVAAERIAAFVHRTPVLTCATLDGLAGRSLFLKCENLQQVGAFKIRGATNAVLRLSDDEAACGVVTHSSGNHAQALALAARRRGIPAHIVMPRNAPSIKRDAVTGYGARVIPCEPNLAAREAAAAAVVDETGGVLVPPFDHPDVIAGQGTAALELLAQVPDLDVLVVPVGGGGLAAGTCLAAATSRRAVRVVGAEPSGADDAARSLAAGRRLPQDDPRTIADGLRTGLGVLTYPILRERIERIVTVDDDAIVRAMRLLFERAKLVVEPSGAVPLAAALAAAFAHVPGARVGIVLSGGNVDVTRLPFASPGAP